MIDSDNCPVCCAFIPAPISVHEYAQLVDISKKYTQEVLQKKPPPQKEYRRYVPYNEDTQEKRTFRCFNIKHHVDTDIAADILDEMLSAVDLTLNLSGDYDEDIYDLIRAAKVKQLERTIPEVFIEVVGTIDGNDIEEFLSYEISEATGWLHEGFEYEEQEESRMIDARKVENDLRLEIDTLLLDMSFDEGEKLKELCNGSDAELNDAYWNYDDEMVSVRPNIDGLRKYLATIKVVRNIN